MVRKQLITLAALAFAGTAALADDITIDNTPFVSMKTRAEVHAEAVRANLAGQTRTSEVDLSPTMARESNSTLTREQVRAELLNSPRAQVLTYNPAA